MAISVDPGTKIVSILKSDLVLVQMAPTEIYEMSIEWLRLQLRDFEDSDIGMAMPTTHINVAPISLSGVQLARVIEIINGYTLTFEDGQYAVNIVGGNSNVGDVVNVNQVSVRTANSAGLVQSREIQYASFDGAVWVDQTSTTIGTIYPTGTSRSPVNNFTDALTIANLNGFRKLRILGDAMINVGSYPNFTFEGEGINLTTLTLDPSPIFSNCKFEHATVTGTLDGESTLFECAIENLSFVSGLLNRCILQPGTITLSGISTCHLIECFSGVPGLSTPIIDCNGDGPPLSIRGFNGGLKLTNKSGAASVSIDLNSGQIQLESSVTAGTVVCRGVGKLTDNSVGATVVSTDLIQGRILNIAADQATIAAQNTQT